MDGASDCRVHRLRYRAGAGEFRHHSANRRDKVGMTPFEAILALIIVGNLMGFWNVSCDSAGSDYQGTDRPDERVQKDSMYRASLNEDAIHRGYRS